MKVPLFKRAADARSRNSRRFKTPLQMPLEEKLENTNQLPLEKTRRKFLEKAEYQNPVCFGWRFVFPDGDFLCENCPKNKLLGPAEIENLLPLVEELIKEGKIKLDSVSPQEIVQLINSCRAASDKRLSDFNRKLQEIKRKIEKRSQEDGDSVIIQEIKIRKTLEPIILNFEKEKETVKNERKKLLKGG